MGIAASDVNNSMSTSLDGNEVMFDLTEKLINSAGWPLIAESDGSGNAITHSGSGVNGYDNANAYRVVAKPTTGLAPYNSAVEIGFQRGGSSAFWKCRLFPTAGSSGGTDTLMPTTVDQEHYQKQINSDVFQQIFGGFQPARYHVIVVDSAEGHGFNVLMAKDGTTEFSTEGVLFMDPLIQPHPDNTFPWVMMANVVSPDGTTPFLDRNWGMTFNDSPQANFDSLCMQRSTDVGSPSFPDGVTQDTPSGDDPALEAVYARVGGNAKGKSTMFLWPGVPRGMGTEYTDGSQAKAYIRFGILAQRWNEVDSMIF